MNLMFRDPQVQNEIIIVLRVMIANILKFLIRIELGTWFPLGLQMLAKKILFRFVI